MRKLNVFFHLFTHINSYYMSFAIESSKAAAATSYVFLAHLSFLY
jgi:hypothetical protein